MAQIWMTGDTHADFRRFGRENFPEQETMTKEDFVIIAGDFGGVWMFKALPGVNDGYEVFCPDKRMHRKALKNEDDWLDWLNDKPFTVLFVPGNHENYDRLYSEEFPTVPFHGGMAKQIRPSVFLLMNGYIFTIAGKKIWTFGGAACHDIAGGIIDLKDFPSPAAMKNAARRRARNPDDLFRVNHYSWWKEEIPDPEMMGFGREQLREEGDGVDFIVTHCAPYSLAEEYGRGSSPDPLTRYLEEIRQEIHYSAWFFGHYHDNARLSEKHFLLYEQMVRIV